LNSQSGSAQEVALHQELLHERYDTFVSQKVLVLTERESISSDPQRIGDSIDVVKP
jgi:hypothetical protein